MAATATSRVNETFGGKGQHDDLGAGRGLLVVCAEFASLAFIKTLGKSQAVGIGVSSLGETWSGPLPLSIPWTSQSP